MTDRLVTAKEKTEDKVLDQTLRPRTLSDFVGQNKIRQNLEILIQAAKNRAEALDHILIYGAPGLGKTSLAHIIAHEIGSSIKITSGPAIERTGDLAAILTNMENGDVLFIDELHRLNRSIEEILYPAMEDYALDIVIGKGPSARTLRLDLPHFTLIGATTRLSLISSPLRNRFGSTYRVDYYHDEEIKDIILRAAKILAVKLDKEAALEIARRSRKTPRVANRLLKRVRDYAQVKSDGNIILSVCKQALQMLEIDELGLDEIDRRILVYIIEKFAGGPVGLNTLAAAVSEETSTIEDIYEPFLMQLGFMARTPRGRIVTDNAYRHLGLEQPKGVTKKML